METIKTRCQKQEQLMKLNNKVGQDLTKGNKPNKTNETKKVHRP
jgi:hypothetical protein